MCGISALISKNPFSPRDLEKMNDLVFHRGPDGYGYQFWNVGTNEDIKATAYKKFPANYLGFGHRRLSILDLTAEGRQPMAVDNLTIVFNGEIYNYVEIKEELKSLGYTFNSRTDTEVLIKSYIQWGEECLNTLNGMFSFLLYDEFKNEIFGARDRFGIKPLYYYLSEDCRSILFGSEIKQIALSEYYSEKEANRHMLYDYLFFSKSDHTHETLFKNIFQIRGGEFFRLSLNQDTYQVCARNWYELGEKTVGQENERFPIVKKAFYDTFFDSISLRLRSDVSVGACLSGGLDSSSIVGTIAQKFNRKVETFSIVFRDTVFNEERFVDSLVDKYDLNNWKRNPTLDSILSQLEEVVYYQDEPVRSFSQYSQFQLFNLVADKDIKVVLNGQGGDEILGGYPSYLFSAMNENKNNILDFKKYLDVLLKEDSLGFYDKLVYGNELICRKLNLMDKLKRSKSLNKGVNFSYFHGLDLDKNKNFFSSTFMQHSVDPIAREFLPQMLHYEDRNSMAFSVESRLPFLDYRLVENTVSAPMRYKLDIKQKYVLKEVMRGIVPEDIIKRVDKKGFATPGAEWAANVESIVTDFSSEDSELFRGIDFGGLIEKKRKGAMFSLNTFKIAQVMVWSKVFNIKI